MTAFLLWVADIFRSSVALASPLYCPRCRTSRSWATAREARSLTAGQPLHCTCGARFTRGNR